MIIDRAQTASEAHAALAPAERVVLWALRAWACCCRAHRLPAEPVATTFAALGVPAAATTLDAAMTRLVLATSRPLAVSCPPHTRLSDDERMLLLAVAAGQHRDRAELRRLFAGILTPVASALVERALVDLGDHLAVAGLVLPPPEPETAPRGNVPVRGDRLPAPASAVEASRLRSTLH